MRAVRMTAGGIFLLAGSLHAIAFPLMHPEPSAPSKYIHGNHRRGFHRGSIQTGRLPHLKIEGGTYFVSFRLADSLPQNVLADIREALAQRENPPGAPAPLSESAQEAARQRDYFRRMERWLDRGLGSCCLRRPEIARLVVDALYFFEGVRHQLSAWVVMPNHVHVMTKPLAAHPLGTIVKSWKQYTARRAKPLLGWRAERFWQIESYDHWVRDAREGARIKRYIHRNPVKAGLCAKPEDWPWSSARDANEADLEVRGP
jgi:type I restriction enzyme R subunit/putative DNA methylase